MTGSLEQLGLSKGEVKVYLALFDLKEGTKYSIAKAAGVSASKVYEIIDKLIKKGLVSSVVKNNVKRFFPCEPTKLQDYVDHKKREILQEEDIVKKIIPTLTAKLAEHQEATKVELFEGFEGMKSVLSVMEREFDPRCEFIAMGIRSRKKNTYNTRIIQFHALRVQNKVTSRMLFTDRGSEFYNSLKSMPKTQIKVLEQVTPAGVAVYRNRVSIYYFGEKPSIILITNEGIAQSFREFFNGLWQLAKP